MTVSTAFSRRLVLAATILAAVGLLAACGSGDDAAGHDDHAAHSHAHGASDVPTSVSAQVNSADVEFATMMIPHHQQAIEMADLVPSRTQNAWLRGFAQQVKAAQQHREIAVRSVSLAKPRTTSTHEPASSWIRSRGALRSTGPCSMGAAGS